MMARIAVVDDERDLREAVCEYLTRHGYAATPLEDAAALREHMREARPDLFILDIGMPGEDGLSAARWLRTQTSAGIIFATAAGAPIDRIIGLEIGADDYLVKPFELRELLARVRSILRRVAIQARSDDSPRPATASASAERVIQLGASVLDLAARRLRGAIGQEVELTASEWRLLDLLADAAGRVVSRERIVQETSSGEPESARAVDIRVARLRRKIEPDPENPRYLLTVRGEGYRLARGVR
jgi:DNA-binding response OmpR family regulator